MPTETNTPPPVANVRADFQDVLAAMAEVDRLKSREELLAAEADLPARVADVTRRLRDVYQQQGVAVPDDVLARGVDEFFAQRLVFQSPAPSLAGRLALLWIHRGRVLAVTATASAVVALVTCGWFYGIVLPRREARVRAVAAARSAILSARDRVRSTERAGGAVFAQAGRHLETVRTSSSDEELPKAAAIATAKLNDEQLAFTTALKQADDTLAPFGSTAAIDEARETAAQTAAAAALKFDHAARAEIDRASAVERQLAELHSARALLDGAWHRLNQPDLAAGLQVAGERTYSRGLAVIAAFGDPVAVRAATAELQQLADASRALAALPAEIAGAAAEARAASRDPKAEPLIAGTEQAGLAAARAGDRDTAQHQLAALRELTARLNATYVLRIVNRPGEHTGVWRFPNGNRTVRNYYIIVEAIGPDGRPVKVPVQSEEDNSTRAVTKWGEHVDESTYNEVATDKRLHGVIRNAVFAAKEKGLLEPTYRLGPKSTGGEPDAGRIYHW